MKRIARFGIVVLALLIMMSCTAPVEYPGDSKEPVPTPEEKVIDDFPAWFKDGIWTGSLFVSNENNSDEKVEIKLEKEKLPIGLCSLENLRFTEKADGYAIATDTSYEADVSETIPIVNSETQKIEHHPMRLRASVKRGEGNCTGSIKLTDKVGDISTTLVVEFVLKETKNQ